MVRLQKRFAYKYKNKEHYKYVVTIPSEDIEKTGWDSGSELTWSYSNNSLVLKPKPEKEEGDEK
jgi:hypothetical protein